MNSYRESDLDIRIPADWRSIPYDRHRYYRVLSGQGYRAVDLLLLHRQAPLALWVEIKNYRYRHIRQSAQQLLGFATEPGLLARLLFDKYLDSARGIAQIDAWYQSRWWWKSIGQRLLHLAADPDTASWLRSALLRLDLVAFPYLAHHAAQQFVCLIELDSSYPDLPSWQELDVQDDFGGRFRENLQAELQGEADAAFGKDKLEVKCVELRGFQELLDKRYLAR